jgi:hypothetical protein
MNEARVKRLAGEGQIEFTRKMFRHFYQKGIAAELLSNAIQNGEVVHEEVFSEPDFSFNIKAPKPLSAHEFVCVQTPDGKMVRVVGVMKSKKAVK